ncbi:MAG: tetratricopeptide repeat protein [Deltaproteobacteria bacterium]|nr:tetratricopeptide repeat protein [Deltaproteobacteria bacterium]
MRGLAARGPKTETPGPSPSWPGLLAALAILAILAPGCAVPPRKALPGNVVLGEFSGPGAQDIRDRLPLPGPGAGDALELSVRSSFDQKASDGRERVGRSDRATPWPEGLPGRERGEPDDQGWETSEYPLALVEASLRADWALTEPGSGAVVASGTAASTLRRSYGGFLASQGLTLEEPPGQEELIRILAGSLADQLAQALGPSYSAGDLAPAGDAASRQAASLAARGDWEGAARLWTELIGQNPGYAPALFNLGLFHERRGDLDKAWAFYRLAFLGDQNWTFRLALTRLTNVLGELGRPPRAHPDPPF